MRKTPKIGFTLAVCLGLGAFSITSTSSAHEGATGILKERMASMESLGKAMKGLAAMVKGQAELTDEAVIGYAETLKMGATQMPEMFPEGMNHAPSEALSNIWTDWDRFKSIATQLQIDAHALTNASSNDAQSLKIGFSKIAKSCKSCHSEYRKKKAE